MTTEKLSLYEGAVSSLVAQQSNENAWEAMVQHAHSFISNGGDFDGLVLEFATAEAQVCKDYSVTRMPTRWRTAKSVVLKAVNAGVKLVRDNGVSRGKSNIEAILRGKASVKAKSSTKSLTDSARCWGHLNEFARLMRSSSIPDRDRRLLLNGLDVTRTDLASYIAKTEPGVA